MKMRIIFAVFCACGLVSGALAEHIIITGTQTMTGFNLASADDILEVASGAELTVTGLGVIEGGGQLIVSGGTLTYNHERVNINDGSIIMYSGTATFDCSKDVKFGDDRGPSYLYLYGGTFRCTGIELYYDREPHIIVGGGAFEIEDTGSDPREWIEHGGVVELAKGYTELVVEDMPAYLKLYALGGLTPSLEDGMANVPLDAVLGWTPGENAVTYDVYLGGSWDQVDGADNSLPVGGVYKGNVDCNSYDSPGEFGLGRTYFWRIDEVNDANINSPWKGSVWSFTTVGKAFGPTPGNGATDVPLHAVLRWLPAVSAVSHDVYLGTNLEAVQDADASLPVGTSVYKGRQDANSYTPELEFGTSYYWRIDEVHPGEIVKGDVWRLTVAEYCVVEDFESYADAIDLAASWDEIEGAYVYLSTDEAREGEQALQLEYFNGFGLIYSEAERTFADAQDWTADDVKALHVFFAGKATNTADRMYVAVEDAGGNCAEAVYDGEPNDLKNEEWQDWYIELQEFADGGVDLTAVKKIAVGLGDRNGTASSGSSGFVHFDDIRLYPRRCVTRYGPVGDLDDDCVVDFEDFSIFAEDWFESDYTVTAVEPDANGLVLWYKFDETTGSNVSDSSGNDYHGTARVQDNNAPTEAFWDTDGKYDGCIKFDNGDKDYCVQVPNEVFTNITDEITISVWVSWDDPATMPDQHNQLFSVHGGPGDEFEGILGIETGWPAEDLSFWDSDNEAEYKPKAEDWSGGWNHYAFVKDASEQYLRIYLNGRLVAESSSASLIRSPVDLARIGIATDRWHDGYTGLLDDLKIYDYALSDAEVVGAAIGGGGELYVPLESPANLSADDQEVNFRDIAIMVDNWLIEQLWP